MAIVDPDAAPESAWLGATFTWTAGFVDAVGYLLLFRIYSANMSGNSVALSIALGSGDWMQAFVHASPILAFFPGLVLGAVMVQACKQFGLRAALMPAVLAEAVLLGLFIAAARNQKLHETTRATDHGLLYVTSIGLLALGMGLQNGALRQIGGLQKVHTYVTGTLLAAAHGITEFLFWVVRRLRHRPPSRIRRMLLYTRRQPGVRNGGFALLLWTVYLVGAIAGTMLLLRFGIAVMAAPICMLVLIASIDFFRPATRHP